MRFASQSRNQSFGPSQLTFGEAVADPWAIDRPSDEARLFEDLEVLGNRRLCQGELVDDLSAKALSSSSQNPKNLYPDGMPQCLGDHGQLVVGPVTLDGAQIRTFRLRRTDTGSLYRFIVHRR